MKQTEATITISGWGDDKHKALIDLIGKMGDFVTNINHNVPPEDMGVRYDEFDETANYAGMYKECKDCKYRVIQSGFGDYKPVDCLWNPAIDPTGCVIENTKGERVK